ncbi:MAG: oligosaccharide flippase family protein [Bacteroidales bacterium]|nr:oligosaccharide flippase family protein [Bacteroidales bacterium]
MKKGIFQILIANIFNLIIGIVLSFMVPKFLSVDSYAMYKMYALYVTYAGFFHFGYADGMYLKYGGKRIDKINRDDLAKNYKNFFYIISIVAILFLIVGLITNDYIIICFSVGQFTTNLLSYLRSLYQATGEFSLYSKALNIEKIGAFIFTFLFLFVFRSDNYLVYIIIQVVVGAIASSFLLFNLNKRLCFISKGGFSFSECVNNISSGIVLMLGNFSSGLFTGLDRWFVKFLMSNSSFAMYSFASSLLNLLNAFISPITISLYNYFCKKLDFSKIVHMKELILAWSLLLIAGAYPVKWVILNFLEKYENSTRIIFILFAAQIFISIIQGVYVNLYKANHMQKYYFVQMISVLIMGIITNGMFYLMNSTLETFAYATLFTYFIWFLICELKNREICFKISNYVMILFLVIVYFGTGFLLNPIVGLLIYIATYVICISILMPSVVDFVLNLLRNAYLKLNN